MVNEQSAVVSLCAVGDVCVDRDHPESIFALAAPVLSAADIAFCQLETMYTERGSRSEGAIIALRGHPRNVSALTYAGFDIVSLAGNHVMDFGAEGIEDTIDVLKRHHITPIGAGRNITEARKPAILERNGVRTAFLAYNSILTHPSYAAGPDAPGCVPIRVRTSYEPIEEGNPGCPVKIITSAEPDDLEAMKRDIAQLRREADTVVISFHWGLHHMAAVLATYETQLAHAAIDAGADLILGSHSHVLKGIEVYKGKVIAYCMGNFAFDAYWKPEDFETPMMKKRIGYYLPRTYDPNYPTFPFPVESRKTIILKCQISKAGVERVSFLPAFINGQGQPEPLARADKNHLDVFNYMNAMCKDLGTQLSCEGDEVLIHAGA